MYTCTHACTHTVSVLAYSQHGVRMYSYTHTHTLTHAHTHTQSCTHACTHTQCPSSPTRNTAPRFSRATTCASPTSPSSSTRPCAGNSTRCVPDVYACHRMMHGMCPAAFAQLYSTSNEGLCRNVLSRFLFCDLALSLPSPLPAV